MTLTINAKNFPQQLRSAGAKLRNNRKLPCDFGQNIQGFMRESGSAIRQPMLNAMHYNPTPIMGRLLAEVLIKNQLEPASCLEIIKASGHLLETAGQRTPRQLADFYLATLKAFNDAKPSFYVEVISLAKPAFRFHIDADICDCQIRRHKNDANWAAAFLAEMDNRRVYSWREVGVLVRMAGLQIKDPLFLAKYAAIRSFEASETVSLIIACAGSWYTNLYQPKTAAAIFEARGWSLTKQAASFVNSLVEKQRTYREPDYLAQICLKLKFDMLTKARLIRDFVTLAKYTDAQVAVLANRMASLTNDDKADRGHYALAYIAELIREVANELHYSSEQKLALAKKVAQLRQLKGDRAKQFLDLVTSLLQNL